MDFLACLGLKDLLIVGSLYRRTFHHAIVSRHGPSCFRICDFTCIEDKVTVMACYYIASIKIKRPLSRSIWSEISNIEDGIIWYELSIVSFAKRLGSREECL
ncbi:hypothetical protein AMTR_s00040p00215320, partial [Amborella trichopoda]